MHNRWILLSAAIIIVSVFFSGCISTRPQSEIPAAPAPVQSGTQTMSVSSPGEFSIRVDSLTDGSVRPDVYTCIGASESPGVAWDGVPAGAKSLVLILDDPDAPGGRFTHWIVYNIPPYPENLRRHSRIQKCSQTGPSRVIPVQVHGDIIRHAPPSGQYTATCSGYMRLIWI